jgi:hypothetical protein
VRHNEKSSLEVISQAVADDKYPAQAETTYYVHCHVNETDSERPGKGTPDNIFASSALKAKPIIGLLDDIEAILVSPNGVNVTRGNRSILGVSQPPTSEDDMKWYRLFVKSHEAMNNPIFRLNSQYSNVMQGTKQKVTVYSCNYEE